LGISARHRHIKTQKKGQGVKIKETREDIFWQAMCDIFFKPSMPSGNWGEMQSFNPGLEE
jgi:hypothetical protein